jgi:hypothetical protein
MILEHYQGVYRTMVGRRHGFIAASQNRGAVLRQAVRKRCVSAMGLEGREAVAPNIKNMHCMFFIFAVTEPPQSPVFCGYCRKKCAQNSVLILLTTCGLGC